jgi:hypothetical protein
MGDALIFGITWWVFRSLLPMNSGPWWVFPLNSRVVGPMLLQLRPQGFTLCYYMTLRWSLTFRVTDQTPLGFINPDGAHASKNLTGFKRPVSVCSHLRQLSNLRYLRHSLSSPCPIRKRIRTFPLAPSLKLWCRNQGGEHDSG